jgi:hypothetical protein
VKPAQGNHNHEHRHAIRHPDFEDLGMPGPLLAAHGYAVPYLDTATDDLRTKDTAAADPLAGRPCL